MPRNSGIYNLPSPPMPLVANTLATAEDLNVTLSDIAVALTGSIASDGTTPITGDLNMNTHNIGGVGTLNAAAVTTPSLNATAGNIGILAGPMNANNQNILNVGNLTGASATINNLTVGNITPVNVWATTVYAGLPAISDFYLGHTAPNRILNWAANWYDAWTEGTGQRSWNSPSGALMTLDGSGNAAIAGSLNVPSNVTVGGTGIAYSGYSSNRFAFQWSAGGSLVPMLNGGGTRTLAASAPDGLYIDVAQPGHANAAFYFAGGSCSWSTTPLSRDAPTNIGPPGDALAAIEQVSLHSFARDGRQTSVGYLPGALATALPEGVQTPTGPDGETFEVIDPVALCAWLCRAVQQIAVRVAALEGAHA
jgi:hypothetical protein